MSYTLIVKKLPTYLHCKVVGTNTVANVRDYLAKVLRECRDQNAASLLIEENLAGPSLPEIDVFRIAEAGGDIVLAPGLQRVAYVDLNPAHDRAGMAIMEEVVRSRGLHVRICQSVSEASDWIAADIAASSGSAPAGTHG